MTVTDPNNPPVRTTVTLIRPTSSDTVSLSKMNSYIKFRNATIIILGLHVHTCKCTCIAYSFIVNWNIPLGLSLGFIVIRASVLLGFSGTDTDGSDSREADNN